MAKADYRCCDVCDRKVFYDADLNWEYSEERGEMTLDWLGAWAVLCEDCSKTHELQIVRRENG